MTTVAPRSASWRVANGAEMAASVLSPQDALVVISHSGSSLDLLDAVRLAKQNVAAMVDFVEPRFHVAIGADWNTRPERPVLDPLRKAGMVSTQDFKRIGTRGAAPIDAFMHKGLVCVDVDTVETSGDHDPVIADLRRKERL